MLLSQILENTWALSLDGMTYIAHTPQAPFAIALRREKTYESDRGTVKEHVVEAERVPLMEVTETAEGVVLSGGGHMSLEDMGVVRSIPGLVVFEPTDTVQLKAAMPVLHAYESPVYMRMNRKEFPTVFPEGYAFDLFKADLLRAGTDVTILAAGLMVSESLQAAETLAAEGISCEVINVHTVKPIDRETILASAKKTGVIVTAENHNVIGGLRSAVLEALAHDPVPVWAVGAEDRFGEVAKLPYLKEALGLNAAHVAAVVREAVQHR